MVLEQRAQVPGRLTRVEGLEGQACLDELQRRDVDS